MKVIVQKFLNEPAVVIGLLVSGAFAYVFSRTAGGIDTTEDALAVIAPFATSLGIRPLVTPAKGK